MTTNQVLTNERKPVRGQEPTSKQRRALIGGAMGGALVALLSSSGPVMARESEAPDAPNDPFIVLLKGVYQPVVHGPNLGLSSADLSDGSYSTTKILPVFGIGGSDDNREDGAIGNFFVQFNGKLCAYQLPGGALAMQFIPGAGFTAHSDGHGGQFLEGTFELTILEATGVFRAFKGGHNHMVDKLHKLADGRFDEFCFCVISTYQFP
jgi:hypothetical protein